MQRARNWRGGEGQHIDLGADMFQTLLYFHAEFLFFVNHQQTQILELDVL